MTTPYSILMLEDTPGIYESVKANLRGVAGYQLLERTANVRDFLRQIRRTTTHIAIVDLEVPTDFNEPSGQIRNGYLAIREARRIAPDLKFVIYSQNIYENHLVQLLLARVPCSVVEKSQSADYLITVVRNTVERGQITLPQRFLENIESAEDIIHALGSTPESRSRTLRLAEFYLGNDPSIRAAGAQLGISKGSIHHRDELLNNAFGTSHKVAAAGQAKIDGYLDRELRADRLLSDLFDELAASQARTD